MSDPLHGASASSRRGSHLLSLLERLPTHRPTYYALLAFLGFIFALGNFPWHLDNYDQAKQAYVAYEIEQTGEIFFQTTPAGRSASKPPLYGWFAAALHNIGIPWDLAHRLPSLTCALATLAILVASGRALLGQPGAFLAAAAFGLNLLTPRLATLVRTDMMLAFFIFLVGWAIYRKVADGTPWTTREKWLVFAAMLGALFTKGPVLYVFLVPGMLAFALLAQPRDRRRLVWSGWWTWTIPLALFLAWGVTGLLTNEAFYEDVVVRELFSRFEEGLATTNARSRSGSTCPTSSTNSPPGVSSSSPSHSCSLPSAAASARTPALSGLPPGRSAASSS